MMTKNAIFQPNVTNVSSRTVIITLVVAVHVFALLQLSRPAKLGTDVANELSISFAMATQAPSAATQQSRTPEIKPVSRSLQPAPVITSPLFEQIEKAVEPSATVPRSKEPVFQAAYLNNPPPSYPMVARRMGLQGRVVLNVEVLADGSCGQIKVGKSSGYAMLDNAALKTVKTWRFLPASQAGQAIDKWFMIPVQFSLKDNAA